MTSLTRAIPEATSVEPIAPERPVDRPIESSSPRALGDLAELTKVRLVAMVLVTTMVGFLLAEGSPIRWGLLLATIVGTGLAAGSAMALNQLLESERDGRMDRTRERPLPAGRMAPRTALAVGGAMALGGTALLLLLSHPLAAILAGANVLLYAFVYTPLKPRTTLNTVVGAVTGALPPMIGWAAARGTLDTGAWLLGSILFLWQLPHFLALAWLYRADYSRGGFAMLPAFDRSGALTAQVALVSSLALVPASLALVTLGLSGFIYGLGALVVGAWLSFLALRFLRERSDRRARTLFLASLVYLPVLLGLMVLDQPRRSHGAPSAAAIVGDEP